MTAHPGDDREVDHLRCKNERCNQSGERHLALVEVLAGLAEGGTNASRGGEAEAG